MLYGLESVCFFQGSFFLGGGGMGWVFGGMARIAKGKARKGMDTPTTPYSRDAHDGEGSVGFFLLLLFFY